MLCCLPIIFSTEIFGAIDDIDEKLYLCKHSNFICEFYEKDLYPLEKKEKVFFLNILDTNKTGYPRFRKILVFVFKIEIEIGFNLEKLKDLLNKEELGLTEKMVFLLESDWYDASRTEFTQTFLRPKVSLLDNKTDFYEGNYSHSFFVYTLVITTKGKLPCLYLETTDLQTSITTLVFSYLDNGLLYQDLNEDFLKKLFNLFANFLKETAKLENKTEVFLNKQFLIGPNFSFVGSSHVFSLSQNLLVVYFAIFNLFPLVFCLTLFILFWFKFR